MAAEIPGYSICFLDMNIFNKSFCETKIYRFSFFYKVNFQNVYISLIFFNTLYLMACQKPFKNSSN